MSELEDVIEWALDRPGAPPGTEPDVWRLSLEDGAIQASRGGGVLKGAESLERFGPNIDAAGKIWPAEFKFHPSTGEPLKPALAQLEPRSGRFGSVSGLPMLQGGYQHLDCAAGRIEVLERGAFFFGQGGQPGFLFAADTKAGAAYRRSRLGGGWMNHGRYPRSTLPPWANGLAGTRDAVFYSGGEHLVRLNEDPEDDGAELYSLGPTVSAPLPLRDTVVVPFRGEEGLEVGWLHLGAEIERVAVRCPQEATPDALLAAPALGAGGIAFWIGEGGFLTFEVDRRAAEAAWRVWPAGFQAKPFMRPYRGPDGALWAFGIVTEEGSSSAGRAAVCELTPGDHPRSVRVLDGPHVSAGLVTYRGRARHARPWDDPLETVQAGLDLGDRWVLPLVTLGSGSTVVALVQDLASMRAFLFREGRPYPRSAVLFLHTPMGGLTPMQHTLDLSSTDDLDVFESEGRLYIYNRDANECVSWPLS